MAQTYLYTYMQKTHYNNDNNDYNDRNTFLNTYSINDDNVNNDTNTHIKTHSNNDNNGTNDRNAYKTNTKMTIMTIMRGPNVKTYS